MGMSNSLINPFNYFFFLSYPNVCLGKDPPYAYKDKADNYDASFDAQRVRKK